MVVAHHARHYYQEASTWSDFGGAGVDIFFIISGFIMVHATHNFDLAGSRRELAVDFFVRRAIRIVPLYWLALLFQNRHALRQGNFDFSLLHDFLFIPRLSQVLPNEVLPSLIVGWTLNFEMFFYVLFGAAILFGGRKYLALTFSLFLLVLAGQIWKFDSAPLRVWTSGMLGEFALGVGVYFLLSRKAWAPRPIVAALVLAAGVGWLAVPNGAIPRL